MEMHVPSPAPIEPDSAAHSLPPQAQVLLDEVSRLPAIARLGIAAVFGLLSWACFFGAAGLSEYKHWVPWAFILLLLEPMGVALALGTVFFVAPQSRLSRWFTVALFRAGAGIALIIFAVACAVVTVIVAGLWELYRLSR
jgi:hypothetical protein